MVFEDQRDIYQKIFPIWDSLSSRYEEYILLTTQMQNEYIIQPLTIHVWNLYRYALPLPFIFKFIIRFYMIFDKEMIIQ